MRTVDSLELVGKLMERYEKTHVRVDNYFGLLAYHALAQAAVAGKNENYYEKCKTYLAQYPDHFEHPYYNFELYRVGGPAKAWMVMKGIAPEWKEQIREYAEITYQSPKDVNGILCRPGDMDREVPRIWIDVAAFATPFMLYAGLALNEERYIDFAAKQCFDMYETFLDESCGLLHQGKGFCMDPHKISEDHWGRGNGWGLIALTELIQYLPEKSVHREKAENYFKNLLDALLRYQGKNGMWKQEITEQDAWDECTSTGLIVYGLGVGMRCGLVEGACYKEAFEKGIEALTKECLTADFATYQSCSGCLCPGQGEKVGTIEAYLTERSPQKDEVHSYGCIMLAFVEAWICGIKEVELGETIAS